VFDERERKWRRPVLIMAGGTGGHVFPGARGGPVLRERGIGVVWLGVPGSMESRLVPANGFPIEWVRVGGVRGKGAARPGCSRRGASPRPWHRPWGTAPRAAARRAGLGGYVSGPGGVAAWLLRIPLLIHEQNAIAGMTNRVLARFASQVLEAFPGSFAIEGRVHARTIGNPVRADIAAVAPPELRFAQRPGALPAAGVRRQSGRAAL
jgi:UDP-N-acetylglucosamine--N-acetylmuramyl-(pentapeptide) pyrophosphoryl-undecaprenol N-acetylglucosamine transferase